MKLAIAPAIGVFLLCSGRMLAADPECSKQAQATSDTYFVVYNVADLPVWRNKGNKPPEFAPGVLIAYVRSAVDPTSWNADSRIRPIEDKASLVIGQTQANHEKIADLFESFRKNDPSEDADRVGTNEAAEFKHRSASRPFQVNDIITVTANSDEMGESPFFDDAVEGATFRIAAAIVDVRSNGNLIIEARRDVEKNKNTVRKTLAGVIRPADIDSRKRTIPINQISELRLQTRTTPMETNAR